MQASLQKVVVIAIQSYPVNHGGYLAAWAGAPRSLPLPGIRARLGASAAGTGNTKHVESVLISNPNYLSAKNL